jgi:aspartate kinase
VIAEKIEVHGILHRDGLAEITFRSIPKRAELVGQILQSLGSAGVSLRFTIQYAEGEKASHLVLCVAEADLTTAMSALRDANLDLEGGEIVEQGGVGMISVFGPEFQERPGVAAAMFMALASADIEIRAISTSIATVTCLVNADSLHEGLQALHKTFDIVEHAEAASQASEPGPAPASPE